METDAVVPETKIAPRSEEEMLSVNADVMRTSMPEEK